jgi:hypothetical protein
MNQNIPETMDLKVDLANLHPKDRAFLKCVVALFTDPQFEALVKGLRSGAIQLAYTEWGVCRAVTVGSTLGLN